MDKKDHGLISALRENARVSLSDLAHRLGVSRTTVRSRIERLQQRGDILGFTVVLKDDATHDPVRGIMMIGIEGRGTDRIASSFKTTVKPRISPRCCKRSMRLRTVVRDTPS